jgi:lysophospholipase L1-like esterase
VEEIINGIAVSVAGAIAPIRAAAPDVPIVAMNYYNPNLAGWLGYVSGQPAGSQPPNQDLALLSAQVSEGFNTALGVVYGGLGITVADVAAAFRSDDFGDRDGDGTPNNVETVCKLTSMCPADGVDSNIHPTRKGYRLIARTFHREVKAASYCPVAPLGAVGAGRS